MPLKYACWTTILLLAGVLGWATYDGRWLPTRDNGNSRLAAVNHSQSIPRGSSVRDASRNAPQPNFVVLVMDDADYAMFNDTGWEANFPNLARLAQSGISFTNCHVTTPKCCPSRASFFRGQYASKLGLTGNNSDRRISNGFPGGYMPYRQRGYDQDDLAVWLRQAGYRTMLVGKYLHNDFDFVVPPGWEDFYYSLGNRYFGTSRFTTATNPAGSNSRLADDEYRTRVETEDACALIDEHVGATVDSPEPFLLYLAPLGPHDQAPDSERVEPRYASDSPAAPRTRGPNFNEADVSDKPPAIQGLPLLDSAAIDSIDQLYRERVLAVKSIDDMLGDVLQTLGKHELLDQTYIFVTSDHGYSLGEHRVVGKGVPYDEASRVPLFVAGPGVAAGVSADHLLAHFDLTATMLELADTSRPEFLDSKSFVPLLADPDRVPADQWRHSVLLEHWEASNFPNGLVDTVFVALRTYRESYIEWAQGDTEYYDLDLDPDQLQNRFGTLPGSAREFLSGMLRVHRQASRAPQATVVGGTGGDQAYLPANSRLFGFADDDTGIQRVRVVVLDSATGTFWNGQSWQPQYTQLVPTLARENGLLTRWEYPLNLQNLLHVPTARILVAARSVDVDGQVSSAVPATVLTIDAAPPETTLTRPIRNEVMSSPARIHGTTADNIQPLRVQITIRDLVDNRYWNGTGWQADRAVIEKRVADTGRWHYFPPLPPGRYGVWVRAFDSAGNFDPTPASAVFTVGN